MTKPMTLREARIFRATDEARDNPLSRICNHVLLSHEETMRLVVTAQNGNWTALEALEKQHALLMVMAQNGDKTACKKARQQARVITKAKQESRAALDKLGTHNVRFVVSIAKRYRRSGIPLQDLISEGCIGFVAAVEKFDVNRGYRLTTYSSWWIRQAIVRSIADKVRTMRIPVHFNEFLTKINRAKRKLFTRDGINKPTPEAILAELDIAATPTAIDNVRRLTACSVDDPVSLDQGHVRDDGSECSLLDLLTGEGDDPESALLAKERLETIRDAVREELADLTDRERAIIIGRIYEGRTLKEIGKDPSFAVCRERIRQLESVVKKKLRDALDDVDRY